MKIYAKYGLMWLFEVIIAVIASFAVTDFIRNMIYHSHLAVQHTQLVIDQTEKVRVNLLQAESSQRGYVITGKNDYLNPYSSCIANIYEYLQGLDKSTKEDDVQNPRVQKLKNAIYMKLSEMNEVIEVKKKDSEKAVERISSDVGFNLMNQATTLLNDIEGKEKQALEIRQRDEIKSINIMRITIPGVVFFNFLMLILVYYFIREQEGGEIKKVYGGEIVW